MADLIAVLVGAFLVNNLVLHNLIGVAPVIAVTDRFDAARDLGLASTAMFVLVTLVVYPVDHLLLGQTGLAYLHLMGVILGSVLGVLLGGALLQMLRRPFQDRYRLFAPLMLANSAVYSIGLLQTQLALNFPRALALAIGCGLGFLLLSVLLAGLSARLTLADIPRPFRGLAIRFVTLGILAMAFMGFIGFGK